MTTDSTLQPAADAERAVPVPDIAVIAQEAPRQGAGQDVAAHR